MPSFFCAPPKNSRSMKKIKTYRKPQTRAKIWTFPAFFSRAKLECMNILWISTIYLKWLQRQVFQVEKEHILTWLLLSKKTPSTPQRCSSKTSRKISTHIQRIIFETINFRKVHDKNAWNRIMYSLFQHIKKVHHCLKPKHVIGYKKVKQYMT